MSIVEIKNSVADVIGNTPLVDLSRITKNVEGRILAKLEYLNPGYSKKDRIALQMIEDAEKDGVLKPGQEVVELTSGNTGTGLAIVCGVKGYKFTAVMSRGNSMERVRMMRALGAEVVLVDQLPGSIPGKVSGGDLELVEKETQKIVKEKEAFRADQFRLKSNFRAHYNNTGPEILKQSDYSIDAFCDFVGSGGTYAGCSAAFKEYDPEIKCYIVEPAGAAILSGEEVTDPNHPVQGGGYSKNISELNYINPAHIDGFIQICGSEAALTSQRLAKDEGILAGYSSGANAAAAIKLLNGECMGKTVVITINDSGLKYFSTDLWE